MNVNAFGYHYHGEYRYIGLNRDWLEDAYFQDRVIYVNGTKKIGDVIALADQRMYEIKRERKVLRGGRF